MKKIIFGLVATVMVAVSSFGQNQKEEDIYNYLKSKYDFEKIEFNTNQSKNEKLLNSLKKDKFIISSVDLNDLNFANVNEIYQKDGVRSLMIPYAKNSKYNLLVSINAGKPDEILKTVLIKNDVDNKGNGNMEVLTPYDKLTYTFQDGKETTKVAPMKNCFRTCFDQAYDDICDGFIGCASWYSSPLPALTAVAYCGVKC